MQSNTSKTPAVTAECPHCHGTGRMYVEGADDFDFGGNERCIWGCPTDDGLVTVDESPKGECCWCSAAQTEEPCSPVCDGHRAAYELHNAPAAAASSTTLKGAA